MRTTDLHIRRAPCRLQDAEARGIGSGTDRESVIDDRAPELSKLRRTWMIKLLFGVFQEFRRK